MKKTGKLPFFQKADNSNINFQEYGKNYSVILLFIYAFCVFLFFIFLMLRLFQLTIIKGAYYSRLAEENRTREFVIEAKRGKILDRKGLTLARNLDSDEESSDERIASKRLYESSLAIAHLVGYRQIASNEDIASDNCIRKLKLGDTVGKKGIEHVFDCDLRGKNGKKLIETDARGKFLKTLTILPPEDGKTISLSVDLDLQKKAYELLQGKKGAVIAEKPQTGEILILTSSPSFNPQDFEDKKDENIRSFLNNKEQPLFNRALEGVFPPGSTFKLVVAAAALEENMIDEYTEFEDTGTIKAGPLTFGNWYFLQYGKTEGMVNLTKAIQRSNDIFFYRISEKLGVMHIKKWADIFGYGKKTGIDMYDVEGLIPSPFWKEEILKDQWYLGDTYNISIGQGYVLATPLQVNRATAVIANNGFLCKPHIIKNSKPQCRKLPLSQKTIDIIKNSMIEACSPGGTGWPLFEFKVKSEKLKVEKQSDDKTSQANETTISTACKTGTSESHAISGIPHAWMTVFAPAENPEIILTVLVEEGGQGSDIAGPIARDILKAYFERNE